MKTVNQIRYVIPVLNLYSSVCFLLTNLFIVQYKISVDTQKRKISCIKFTQLYFSSFFIC